ncbi:MAG: hypothetical protein QOJ80_243 [Mycobacterium sp.]|nr:hypothetical protein [Mycobacterium sp.]
MALVKSKLPAVPTRSTVLRELRTPLLRNGHLLTLSSALTAIVGLGYWTVAAWKYDPATVGSNAAAISMMTLVAAVSQLNLSSAMVRFVPTAGRRTRRLVARVYLLSACVALVVGVCSVALVRLLSPGTEFLEGPLPQAMFVFATVAYTIFVIQDSVLTALHRTALVPLENFVFAVVKLGMVVVLASALPWHGIFASWALALGGAVVVVGIFIFGWAIPRHQRSAAAEIDVLPPVRQMVRYVVFDYLGAILSIGSITLLPILVIAELGAEQNAYFAIAWLIAYSVHLINVNMSTSLVVESAVDQSRLAHQVRHVLAHTSKLLVFVVFALLVSAPYLLDIFGHSYRDAGDTLRLLALAVLPHLVVATAIGSVRAQRRTGLALCIQGLQCVLALPLTWLLLPIMGLTGAGLAWLVTQSLIACGLLIRRDLWLTLGPAPAGRAGDTRAQRLWWSMVGFGIRLVSALRLRRPLERAAELLHVPSTRVAHPGPPPALAGYPGRTDPKTWTNVEPISTVTDVAVAFVGEQQRPPAAVLKAARSPLGSRDLQAQRDVLTVLGADPRLDEEWRNLLPRILEFRDDGSGSLSVETFRPAVDLWTALKRSPDSFESLTTAAVATIAELHHRTGKVEVVDDGHLEQWVDEPLSTLTEMCQTMAPKMLPTVGRLGKVLRGALANRLVLVSWTHGDFAPGNVRLASEQGRVTGVIDWGGARPGQLAVLDCYHMLLSASRVVERRELGAVVKSRLRAGHLTERERRPLDIGCGSTRKTDVDDRVLILLAWLHHVAQLNRKCGVYRNHRIWWALNAQPVLRTLRAVAPTLEADLRTATLDRAVEPTSVQIDQHDADATTGRQLPTPDASKVSSASVTTLCLEEDLAKPSVTVVICAYTEQRWDDLVQAVASVQRQTEPPDEILLVIDYCPGLFQRAREELPGITVCANRYEKGLSGARNTGISVATCDVVAFLDDDATATPDWIAALVAPYADPRVIGVGGRVQPNWRTERPRWFPPEFDWVVGCSYRGLPTESGPVRNFIGANMSLLRDILVESGGFDAGLGRIASRPLGCEETELCIRVARTYPDGVHLYEPAAEVLHSVPDSRGTWSYFRSRCYAEGLSKAVVSRLAGANRALAAERTYLSSTIPRGFLRYVGEGLRGRPWGFAAAVAMVVGVTTTMMGYAVGRVQTMRAEAKHVPVGRRLARIGPLAGLAISLALWLLSLPRVELDRIGDYGLIPLLPITFWVALAVLLVSFSVLVRRAATATPLLVAHVLTLIAILHATPCLLYGTLRYSWAWKHVGVVDYFLRQNGVNTGIRELSAYQNWPAFFNINAMLDKAAGLQTSLDYAVWAPPFFNVLLIGPLFLIFRTFTADRRLVWSAILIFFMGSWVGQDYFAPQACAYFLYLTVIALCLRYLGRHSDVRARDRRLIAGLAIVPMMAAIAPTHQLTPLMLICGLGVLAVFCRQRVWLLMLLMIGFTVGWDLMFAGEWINENLKSIASSIGTLGHNADSGFINLGAASHSQAVVAQIDRAHSAVVWALGFVGLARRFRRRSELAMPLLAVAPIPLIMTNDYGGEMIFRVYLFGLPFVAFYAAAAFFPREISRRSEGQPKRRRMALGARVALPVVLLLLVPGFAAGYYGKEQGNYFSPQEVSAAKFLYGIAPRGSLLIGTTSDFPWAFMNFESYDYLRFALLEPKDRQAILDDPAGMLSDIMAAGAHHHAYLLLSRAQEADVEMIGALPRGTLARIKQTLIDSPKFTVIYRNPSATVITLTQPAPEDGGSQPVSSGPEAGLSQPASPGPEASGAQPSPSLGDGGDCANLQADVTGLLSTPINFDTDGFTLTEGSQQLLNPVADKLKSCSNVSVAVSGYTDNTGDDAFNIPLSANQAKSVADYLVSQGVVGDFVTSTGLGSANPIENTPAGRAQNRRVEISIS